MELLSLGKYRLGNQQELMLVTSHNIFLEDIWCILIEISNRLLLQVSTILLDKELDLQLKIQLHNSILPNINLWELLIQSNSMNQQGIQDIMKLKIAQCLDYKYLQGIRF